VSSLFSNTHSRDWLFTYIVCSFVAEILWSELCLCTQDITVDIGWNVFVPCMVNLDHYLGLFLAECHKSWLNQASFVLLCFVLFAFSGFCLVSVLWMALNSLMVLLWIYSLTHSRWVCICAHWVMSDCCVTVSWMKRQTLILTWYVSLFHCSLAVSLIQYGV